MGFGENAACKVLRSDMLTIASLIVKPSHAPRWGEMC